VAVKICRNGVPGMGLNCMKSGRNLTPGQLSSLGVPSAENIFVTPHCSRRSIFVSVHVSLYYVGNFI
jgi:hypothetical protein